MLCHGNACGLDVLTLIKRSPKLRSKPVSFLSSVCFSNGLLALFVFATILYYTESDWDGDSGVVFSSVEIPKGLFATTLILTGEFTLDEFSPLGEFFALLACLGSIGIIAVPASGTEKLKFLNKERSDCFLSHGGWFH